MKQSHRVLLLLPPLAGLVLLLLPGAPPTLDTTGKAAPQAMDSAQDVSATTPESAPPRKVMPLPPAGAVWSFTGTVAGDDAGLRTALAADSRGKGKLPEGRRFEVGALLNLRTLQEGEHLAVSLPDGRTFDGRVNWSRRDEGYANAHQVSIGFTGDKGGLVATHDGATGGVWGRLLVEGDLRGWTLESGNGGGFWLVEHRREDMVCEMPGAAAALRANPLPGDPLASTSSATPPVLNSRPGSTSVLYIDFDGEPTRTYPDWPCGNPATPIAAPHSGLNVEQMTKVWRRVAEDFIQFNINVSTERAKYTAVGAGNRMRIIVAGSLPPDPNNTCAGSAGLAIVGSFDQAGNGLAANVPCWLAVSSYVAAGSTPTDAQLASMASNITHEFGHTLGLNHDGAAGDADGYYDGHGTSPYDWSPIMGSPYRPGQGTGARAIIQWAKNDYPGANNTQDDLWIISGTINGFGYAADENAGYITANHLTATGTANQVGGEGVITNKDDLDWWLLNVRFPGTTTIEVAPADTALSLPNLDCGFRVENNLGETVAGGFHPEDNLESSATLNLAPGTYYVVTYGTGNKTWTTGGYDDYGSTGRYLVTVNLPPDTQDPVPVILSPTAGTLTSPSLQFNGTATDNDRVSGFSIFLRRNSDNAYWNGSYWQIGPWQLDRDHNGTTGAWNCTATLPQVGGSGPGSLNAGSYDFIAIAEDPAGRAKEVKVTVTVDSAGPAVTVGSPSVTLSAAGYTFSGTSQDSNGVQAVNCFIRRDSDGQYWNGGGWGAPAINLPTNHTAHATGDSRPWTCVSPNLPQPGAQLTQGTYTFIAIATDPLGNHTQADSVVLIDDGQPPQVAVTTPAHDSFVSALSSIGGTATDMSGIQYGNVAFTLYQVSSGKFWSGSNWVSGITVLNGTVSGNNWTFSAMPQGPFLTAGQYLISSNARDNAGTLSQPVTGVNQTSFRVDLDPPAVTITAPQDGAVIASLPAVSGSAQDTNGISAVKLYLYRFSDGKFWDGSAWGGGGSAILPTQVTGNSWVSLPAANLPQPGSNPAFNLTNGGYNLMAFAVDSAGNQTRTDAVVTVELTYTWTGATLRDAIGNNDSNSWDTAANWDPVGVPGSDDKVIIANGDRVDSGTSRTVLGLQLSSGTLNFTTGDRTLTTVANSTWAGGTMTGVWENQGTITTSGPGPKVLWDDAVLNNHGTIVWTGSGEGPIQARAAGGAGAVINNKPGAVFRIAGAGQVFTREYGNRRPVFNNENGARLERDGSGGFATLTIWEFQNAGEIRAQTGILTFLDDPFDGYDFFLNPGTTLTGAAYLRINNATQLNTAVHAQCSVEMVDSSWLGCPGAAGVAKFEGTLNWWGGVIFGNLTIGSAGVLNATDIIPATPVVKQLWDDTTLDNDGIINWTGGAPIRARAAGGAGAVINNRSGGIFNLTSDGTVFAREYGNRVPVFNNLAGGIFRKTAGTSNTAVDTFAFNHRGGMVCDAGTMSFFTAFDAASTTPWTGAGDFELHGGELTITGALHLNGPSFTILNGNVWGAADGSGAFTTTGGSTVEWKGGTFLRTLKLTAGSTLNLSGPEPKVLWDDAVLDNDGTITWQGGGPLRARAAGGSGAVVNNRSGARFEAAADGEVFTREYGNRTPVFNNQAGATLARTAGSGTATVHTFQINNDSTITAQTGVFAFNTVLNLNNSGTLNGAGRFEMPGGVVNVTGGTSLVGTSFSVLAGDIVGLAGASWTSTAGGIWRWLGGALSGTLELGPDSTLQIADPAAVTAVKVIANDAVLNNRGTIEWSGVGPIRAQASGGTGSIIANKSGSVFRALSDGPLLTREYTNRMPRFIVESGAQWQKPSGDAAVPTTCDWSFENAGSVNIGGGTVDLLQGGDSSGSFTATGSGVLRFRGGTHTLRSGVVLSGNGRIQVDGGTVNGEGALIGNATAPGAFELLSGFLGGTLNYSGAGLLHWSGGSLAGVLSLAAGTRADLDGPSVKYMWDDAVLNNSGTVTWLGSGAIQARAAGGTGAIINNQSGGIFRIAADGDVFSREYGNRRPVFYNRNGGRFEKSGGGGASTCGVWEFHSAGEMRCGTGTFSFVDGPYDGYDLYLEPGASLTGTGRLRLQTATHLTTAVHAQGPVDLPEPSWLGCPPPAEGSAPSRFEGLLNWTGGVIWGELVVGPAGIVEVNDAVPGTPVVKQLWDDTTLHNEGLIRWQGGAPIRARAAGGAGAVINNRAGASFQAAADGVVFAREYGNRLPVFNNLADGTFRKTGGTGNTAVDTFAFNHRGGMVCDSGTISFFTALDVASATPWTGAGDFELHGGELTITGVMQMNGPSFTIRDGTVWGATDGSGAFGTAAGGSIEWQGGTFVRTLRLTAGSTMNLTGPAVKALWDDAVLENDGSIIWHGGGPLRARAAGGTGAVLNNRAGSLFHAAASGAVLTREYGNRVPVLLNAGTLRLGLPIASCSFDGWSFTQINGGGLQVDVAGIAAGEFDSLSVNNGAATIAGTLSAANINGYAPATGTTFPFLTAGTVTGTFAIVTGGFSAEYTGATATLRAGAAALTFNDWAASEGLTGANALPSADPDNDGYSNFFEYVHNMDPAAAGGAPLSAETVTVGPQQFLTLSYRTWADREAAGVTYTPEAGSLTNWGTAAIINEVDTAAPVIPGSTAWKARVPIIAGEGKFLRLKAEKP